MGRRWRKSDGPPPWWVTSPGEDEYGNAVRELWERGMEPDEAAVEAPRALDRRRQRRIDEMADEQIQRIRDAVAERIRAEATTQARVSQDAGVPQPALSRFLNGKSLAVEAIFKLVLWLGWQVGPSPR